MQMERKEVSIILIKQGFLEMPYMRYSKMMKQLVFVFLVTQRMRKVIKKYWKGFQKEIVYNERKHFWGSLSNVGAAHIKSS